MEHRAVCVNIYCYFVVRILGKECAFIHSPYLEIHLESQHSRMGVDNNWGIQKLGAWGLLLFY